MSEGLDGRPAIATRSTDGPCRVTPLALPICRSPRPRALGPRRPIPVARRNVPVRIESRSMRAPIVGWSALTAQADRDDFEARCRPREAGRGHAQSRAWTSSLFRLID